MSHLTASEHEKVTLPGVHVHEAYVTLNSAQHAPKVLVYYRAMHSSSTKQIMFTIHEARSVAAGMPLDELARLVEKTLSKKAPKGLKRLQGAFPKPTETTTPDELDHIASARVVGGARHGGTGVGLGAWGESDRPLNDFEMADAASVGAMQSGVASALPALALGAAMGCGDQCASSSACAQKAAPKSSWNPFAFASSWSTMYADKKGVAEANWHRHRRRRDEGFDEMSKVCGVASDDMKCDHGKSDAGEIERRRERDVDLDTDIVTDQAETAFALTVDQAIRKHNGPDEAPELRSLVGKLQRQVKAFEQASAQRDATAQALWDSGNATWGSSSAAGSMSDSELVRATKRIVNMITSSSDQNFKDAATLVLKILQHPRIRALNSLAQEEKESEVRLLLLYYCTAQA